MTDARPSREARRWPVARVGELAPGDRKLVTVKRYSIGLFNVNGDYRAALNLCPHELAPLCKGRVSGTTLPSKPGEFVWGREGEIISCPWHGWEFDLRDGRMLADQRVRVRMYPVEIVGDDICIVI